MKFLNVIAMAAVVLAGAANAQTMDHAAHMKMIAEAQRQAEVSKLGKDVMPFTLAATTHVFSKSETGGTQQVVAKAAWGSIQRFVYCHCVKPH